MIIIQILIALAVLSVLIFIHELGHFLVAKMNKVTVLEFAIGFGKVVWQKRYGTTKYSLRLIPLGGFVRMAGDDYNQYYFEGEEKETEEEEADKEKFSIEPVEINDEVDEATLNDRSRWFFEKSIAARSAIVFAGPLFNFLLAWILVFGVYMFYGASEPINNPVIGDLIPDYPAEKAGLQAGDYIKNVNGKSVASWEDLVKEINSAEGEAVDLFVLRSSNDNVDKINLTLKPQLEAKEMQLLLEGKDAKPRYLIGIQAPHKKVQVSTLEALMSSSYHIYYTSVLTLKSIWYLIVGEISAKHIGGPITIMEQAASSAKKGFERLLMFTVFISISLAVLNLLPIPVLDGGHLMLFFFEWIKGGRLNKRFMEVANQFGMFILLALMVFAIGNDLFRMGSKFFK